MLMRFRMYHTKQIGYTGYINLIHQTYVRPVTAKDFDVLHLGVGYGIELPDLDDSTTGQTNTNKTNFTLYKDSKRNLRIYPHWKFKELNIDIQKMSEILKDMEIDIDDAIAIYRF